MSAVPPGQPPQRACPRCSTISRTVDAHCPFCGAAFRRRGPWAGVAAAALLSIAAILAGMTFLLVDFGNRLDDELNDQVESVQRDFDRDVRRLEERIEQQLDERLPPTPNPGG
jgi:cell division protein FtsX